MSESIRLYRCTECGKLSTSIGYIHGHVETHRGWGPFNFLPPLSIGNANKLDEFTEEIDVEVVDSQLRSEI